MKAETGERIKDNSKQGIEKTKNHAEDKQGGKKINNRIKRKIR